MLRARPLRRRALATLELVLALPVLLLLMALLVNFGVAVCWRLRTQAVTSQALWESRFDRSAGGTPRPAWWPESGYVTAEPAGSAATLDDPRLNHPVVRGPRLRGVEVRGELFDPTRGFLAASAELTRGHPMLGKLGDYRLDAHAALLDATWTYQEMGLARNDHPRFGVLYAPAPIPPERVADYVAAVQAILDAPFRDALRPLDRDDEFIFYHAWFGWQGGPPDFHPRREPFCRLEPGLADRHVSDLIDRIQGRVERDAEGNVVEHVPGVPEQMARAFIDLYRRAIHGVPPLPPATIGRLQEEVAQLEHFLSALSPDH